MTRALLALLATLVLAFGAAAQTAEFGHATGGTIETITKAPRQTSGSLGLTHSPAGDQGYEGSLGGELIHDERLAPPATAAESFGGAAPEL